MPSWLVIFSAILTISLGLVILGALLPRIPVAGLLGSSLSGNAEFLAVAGIVTTGLSVWAVTSHPTGLRVVFLIIAVLALAAVIAIGGRLQLVGRHHGASVRLFAPPVKKSDPDVTDTYGDWDGKPLGVAIWKPNSSEQQVPVALFVHGGGFVSGGATDSSWHRRWFADQGWLVISVGYALSSKTEHLWDVATGQIADAMAWTAKNAARYGGDATRLTMHGDSAGGNLAMNAAYAAAAGTLTGPSGESLPHVQAVAVLYPVVDLIGCYNSADPLLGRTARSFAEQYTGGTPTDVPERYAAVAPATQATEAAPPTLIILGTNDHLVPPAGAYQFADDASETTRRVDLVRIPFGEHVFDRSPLGSQLYQGITRAWLDEVTAPA